QLFLGVAEAGLAGLEGVGVVGVDHGAAGVELAEAVGRPAGVRRGGGQALFALGVAEHAAAGVDEQHLAGAEPAALDETVAADVDGARFGAADDETVLADGVAEGTKAVAVEGGAHANPVGDDDAGGAVPR